MGAQHHLACRALLRHGQWHDLGTPTVLQTTAKAYTIWANNSGGSSLVTVTITINDVAPGSFEYEPENNTLTNNTGVHLAPQFINRTTGNGSTWSVTNLQTAQGTSSLGHYMDILVGDTIYFSANDGTTGTELWAHDTSNHSTWQVADINNWITMGGLRLSSNPGEYMAVSVGDTIYFSAKVEQQGTELWAHNTTNGTTWRVADIRSGSAGAIPDSGSTSWLATSSTSQPMMGAKALNYGHTTHPMYPHGKLLTSGVVPLEAILDRKWVSSLAT